MGALIGIRPPQLGCLCRAHQGPHGIHVDEPKKQVRGEKRTLPTDRQQTSAKLRYQSTFSAQGCAFVARLCCLSHTTTLSTGFRGFTVPILMLPHSSPSQGEPTTEKEFLNCPTKICVLVPPLTQRKEEGEATCPKLSIKQSQKYKIIGIILACSA